MSAAVPTNSTTSKAHMLAEWAVHPEQVHKAIDSVFRISTPGFCPPLVSLVVDYLKKSDNVFGENEWNKLVGKVSPVPRLPLSIENAWQSPCPISTFGERVCETHLLVYIPSTVQVGDSQQLFNLNTISALMGKHFLNLNRYGQSTRKISGASVVRPYWVLMYKEIVPLTRKATASKQEEIVANLAVRAFETCDSVGGEWEKGYELPKSLEAATCMLAQYALFGIRLFEDEYIRCKDETHPPGSMEDLTFENRRSVGSFKEHGFTIADCPPGYDTDDEEIGAGAVRRLDNQIITSKK